MATDVERLARAIADDAAESDGLLPYSDISWACVRGQWITKAERILSKMQEPAGVHA